MIETRHDCIVVGAGHAGIEAAHILARANFKVLLVTMNLDELALMSCNPAIGGIAKGHIVREVDALGGIMGHIIDHTGIHFKMLNKSKGSAMWSPRAQADKTLYRNYAKKIIEENSNIHLLQDTVSDLIIENGIVMGVQTERAANHYAHSVILTTGTFLKGRIHIGDFSITGGRFGSQSSETLSSMLSKTGFEIGRLKTGTPPRIHADTMDIAAFEIQQPDEEPQPFSYEFEYENKPLLMNHVPCYITYTTKKTAKIVKDNLLRSALYGGKIKSVGPRYCPSIEDKIVRFADKERHQIFLEPEGISTKEVYVNGISTSLPEDVQLEIVHSIIGLEKAEIMRPGYAIEYDFAQPTQLNPWLETKKIENLYFAGQINGTTGYEEAAGQGLVAGYNVIHRLREMEPFVLKRDEAYLGVLIDDLVTKGVEEPYRMFTSRAEYRLLLRQDNADYRLMKYAKNINVDNGLYEKMEERYARYEIARKKLTLAKINDEIIELLKPYNISIQKGLGVASLFKRPQIHTGVSITIIDRVIHENDVALSSNEKIKIAMEIKYEGYIEREKTKIKRRLESTDKKIPKELDYTDVPGLKTEARQKLIKIQPMNIGQAARISGVDPSDVDILLIYLNTKKNGQ